MYRKLLALIALFAVLFSVAFANDFSGNIQLKVYEDSSRHWLSVDPIGDNDATVKVEMLEADSDDWVTMTPDGSGFYEVKSPIEKGFTLPVSFRLTAEDGEQLILDNVLNKITPGKALATAVQFQQRPARKEGDDRRGGGNSGNTPDWCPTHAPSTSQPTSKPSTGSSSTPTTKPTTAPTSKPSTGSSSTPTTKPTAAPTTKPSTGSSSGSSTTDLCAVPPTSQEPIKILVPLYMEPGSSWDSLISSANAGTSIIAIINPNNGPVSSGPPSNWVTYMNKMNQAGIDMVGYVHTSYGSRSSSDVKADIDTYASKYAGLKGIFLDEVSADKSEISYYQTLYTYIMGKSGYVHDILNPGATPDSGYVAVSTNIVVYEDSASGFKAPTSSFIKCAPSAAQKAGYKYHFSGIVYGASQSQMTTMAQQMASAGLGMVYITDRTLPNPYDPLPSYWSTEATTVKGL